MFFFDGVTPCIDVGSVHRMTGTPRVLLNVYPQRTLQGQIASGTGDSWTRRLKARTEPRSQERHEPSLEAYTRHATKDIAYQVDTVCVAMLTVDLVSGNSFKVMFTYAFQ